jgi:hypothetical protein
MTKKLLLLAGLIFSCIAITLFCNSQTGGFTIAAIEPNRPYNPAWEVRALSPLEKREVDLALSQKYSYFGYGGQAFVFFSADGKYALKLLKQHSLEMPAHLDTFPISWIFTRYVEKKRAKRLDKLRRDFASYKAAFEELPVETGLLLVHLNPTSDLKKELTLTDALGIEHHLQWDKLNFVIQKRAQLVPHRLLTLIQKGESEKAKEAVLALFNLVRVRCKKGFQDRDPCIFTNCGFIEGSAIKIDVGRLMKNEVMKEPEMIKKEVVRVTMPLKAWLAAYAPELLPTWQRGMDETP